MNTLTPETSNKLLDFRSRVLLENSNYLVAPTLGALVNGYCVIFAKQQAINLRYAIKTDIDDLLEIFSYISAAIEEEYGRKVVFFEHGSILPFREVGCGVDQAHLHVLPYDEDKIFNVLSKRFNLVGEFSSLKESLMSNCLLGSPYLVYGSLKINKVWIFDYGLNRESQAVRKILAELEGKKEKWDWKEYLEPENMYTTYLRLKKRLSS